MIEGGGTTSYNCDHPQEKGAYLRCVGATEEEKFAFFKDCEDHLERVRIEHSYYHTVITETRNAFNLDRTTPRRIISECRSPKFRFRSTGEYIYIFFKQYFDSDWTNIFEFPCT